MSCVPEKGKMYVSAIFDVFACVLEGDDEEVYWCCGCLADRSIVVMDGEGNYYHVEKGKGKRYIACNAPKAGEADLPPWWKV